MFSPHARSPLCVRSARPGLMIQEREDVSPQQVCLLSRMATALAEHVSCGRCGSACLITREQASERSLFLREEAQEQVPVHHLLMCYPDESSCSPAPHCSVCNSLSTRALAPHTPP